MINHCFTKYTSQTLLANGFQMCTAMNPLKATAKHAAIPILSASLQMRIELLALCVKKGRGPGISRKYARILLSLRTLSYCHVWQKACNAVMRKRQPLQLALQGRPARLPRRRGATLLFNCCCSSASDTDLLISNVFWHRQADVFWCQKPRNWGKESMQLFEASEQITLSLLWPLRWLATSPQSPAQNSAPRLSTESEQVSVKLVEFIHFQQNNQKSSASHWSEHN